MSVDDIRDLAPAEFAAFVADLWSHGGWQTTVNEREDGRHVVVGVKSGGKRGLVVVHSGPGSRVTEDTVREFVRVCESKGVDVPVVAVQGDYTDRAEQLAEAYDVFLLDPEALVETVREGGYEAVLDRHVGDGDDADENGDDAGPLAALGGRLPGPVRSVAGVAAVALLVGVVAMALGGGIAGVDIAGFGGGDAPAPGGVATSAVSTAGPGTATIEARWNATARSTLTVDGSTYAAPPDERFVVVGMRLTNVGADPVPVGESAFVYEADGRRYGHQPLNGTSTGLAAPVVPGETRSAWVVFSVPENTTAGTVLVRPRNGSAPLRVRFDHDPSVRVVPGSSG